MTGTLLSEASIWDFVSHLTDSISLDIPLRARRGDPALGEGTEGNETGP